MTFGTGLTSLGENVFANTAVEELDLSMTGLTSLPPMPHRNSIKTIILPPCIEKVDYNLSVENLILSEGTTRIGNLIENGRITNFTIPASVTQVSGEAFQSARVDTVYFGGTQAQWEALFTEENKDSKLWDAKVIFSSGETQDFVVQNGVLTEYRGSGGDIVVPGNAVRVARGAFLQIDHGRYVNNTITSAAFSEGAEVIEPIYGRPDGSDIVSNRSLSSVTLPRSLKELSQDAFSLCYGLSSVTFHPDSSPVLETGAFNACGELTSVTLPNNGWLGSQCFLDCRNLKELTVPAGVEVKEESFWGMPSDAVIYGMPGSTAEYWAVRTGLKFVDIGTVQPEQPAGGTAYASTQTVLVDGKPVEFQTYALKDENGNDTNYVKLRDVAFVLNGSAAQFSVGWDQAAGSISVTVGQPYKTAGGEMSTPYSGNRSYAISDSPLYINGQSASLTAILLTDDAGNGYTYFKLRDLGSALGFTVDWSAEKGIFIETK